MNAVITGATGLVGSLVLRKLLENSQFSKVISVSRRSLPLQNAKLEQILVPDFSKLSEQKDLLRGDIYFCCLGTTIKEAGSQEKFRKVDYEAILKFGKIAKLQEAQSFVLISAMGANSKSSIFNNQVKGETEEAMQAMNFKSLTIFRPGLLLGNRHQPRRGEQIGAILIQTLSPILPQPLEKLAATRATHLADRMIEEGLRAQPGMQIIASVKI